MAGDGLFRRWMRGRREDLAVATKAEVRGGPQAHNCAFGRIRSFFSEYIGQFQFFLRFCLGATGLMARGAEREKTSLCCVRYQRARARGMEMCFLSLAPFFLSAVLAFFSGVVF